MGNMVGVYKIDWPIIKLGFILSVLKLFWQEEEEEEKWLQDCISPMCSVSCFMLWSYSARRHVQTQLVREPRQAFEFRLILPIVETISGFPALIEVTLEELETGLENGQYTSVDLVNVCPCTLFEISQFTISRRTLPGSMKSMALFTVLPRSIPMPSALRRS